MKNQHKRPQEEDIEEPDEAEEELHVDSRLSSNPDLEQGDVERIKHGRQEREGISP